MKIYTPIRLFFILFILELVLCGSGQVIHVVEGFTLRMLIFLLALCVTLFRLHRYLSLDIWYMLLFYIFTSCISISICFLSNNTIGLFDDIKQLSFFIILPFIFYMVTNKDMIKTVSKVIRLSTLLMAVIYLVYIVLIKYMQLIDFHAFYINMGEESDFMFRGTEGELFYKGFLYLVIGLLFWIKEKSAFCSIFMLLAIYYTMTRGFYVITIMSIVLLYILNCRIKSIATVFMIFICLILLFIAISISGLFEVGEDRIGGDELRMLTIQQVFDRITLFSFFFGHGFGIGVPIRMVHMENSFLEIFHKQGVLGLSFWGYLLYKIIVLYRCIPVSSKSMASVYIVGTIAVYIQSVFNPFLTNPIGMGFVLLSFVVCKKLSYYDKNIMCCRPLSAKTL